MIEQWIAPILVLGVLVLVHEFGHFWVAKRLGVRVLKFSIGMGPRLAGIRRGDTEYLLSWIPFGGYVKMAGEDPEEAGNGAPDEFHSKRPLVRAAIIAAGPAMNYLLAIVLYTAVVAVDGVGTIRTRVVGHVEPGSAAERAGFIAGDEVLAVGGRAVARWDDFADALAESKEERVLVRVARASGEVVVEVDIGALRTSGALLGLTPFLSTEVGEVQHGGPAWRAGLRRGDRIVSIAGRPVAQWHEVASAVRGTTEPSIEIAWDRAGTRHVAMVAPEWGEIPKSDAKTERARLIRIGQKTERERLPLHRAVELGTRQTIWASGEVFGFLASLVRGRVSFDMVGGPVQIGIIAGESARWGLGNLVPLVALLSVNLAILNLLPIPILDGGHLFIMTVEKAIRRPLSLRQRLILQQIGLAVIILLMVTVTAADFRKLFR